MFTKQDQTNFTNFIAGQDLSEGRGEIRTEAVQRGIKGKSMLYDKNRRDDSQLYWLFDLASEAPDGLAVECGVYLGGSLVTWAVPRQGRGPIYVVDNWSSGGGRPHQKQIFMANLGRYGIEATVLEMDSWLASDQIGQPVAFCFVDAGHDAPSFSRDIAVWPPKMMPGGIICFHDYDVWKPGVVVKDYVDRWFDPTKWGYLGLVGSAVAFRRGERG